MAQQDEAFTRFRACWDCQFPMMPGDAALCESCAAHRADGHEPRATNWPPQVPPRLREFCHGAGPNGLNHALADQAPRPIYIERRGPEKNPHMYRVDVCEPAPAYAESDSR